MATAEQCRNMFQLLGIVQRSTANERQVVSLFNQWKRKYSFEKVNRRGGESNLSLCIRKKQREALISLLNACQANKRFYVDEKYPTWKDVDEDAYQYRILGVQDSFLGRNEIKERCEREMLTGTEEENQRQRQEQLRKEQRQEAFNRRRAEERKQRQTDRRKLRSQENLERARRKYASQLENIRMSVEQQRAWQQEQMENLREKEQMEREFKAKMDQEDLQFEREQEPYLGEMPMLERAQPPLPITFPSSSSYSSSSYSTPQPPLPITFPSSSSSSSSSYVKPEPSFNFMPGAPGGPGVVPGFVPGLGARIVYDLSMDDD